MSTPVFTYFLIQPNELASTIKGAERVGSTECGVGTTVTYVTIHNGESYRFVARYKTGGELCAGGITKAVKVIRKIKTVTHWEEVTDETTETT